MTNLQVGDLATWENWRGSALRNDQCETIILVVTKISPPKISPPSQPWSELEGIVLGKSGIGEIINLFLPDDGIKLVSRLQTTV